MPSDPFQDFWERVVPRMVRKACAFLELEVPERWRETIDEVPGPVEEPKLPHEELYEKLSKEEVLQGQALASKQNAELLQEIVRVVIGPEALSNAEFGDWVDSLNQGASLEGMYNGLIHSTKYSQLERGGLAASPSALDAFATEMAWFERELPGLTEFDFDSHPVRAIPAIAAKESPNPEMTSREFSWSEPTAEELEALKKQIGQTFLGKNFFLLKRVLGDEALRAISLHQQSQLTYATWFGHWVGHTSQWGVDFGLKGRMQTNPSFHYQWALKANQDRVTWEVLNRLHRVLNAKK